MRDEIRKILGLALDADLPKSFRQKILKTNEEAIADFYKKNEYLLYDMETALLDIEEVDVREFVEWIFERRVECHNFVQPFEDVQSQEYLIWKKQIHTLKEENEELKRDAKKRGVEYKNKTLAEKKTIDYRGYACWRYNPIIFYKDDEGKPSHRLLLHEDDSIYTFLEQRQFALLSPVTYVGRNNTSTNARYLYALAFDLDGVGTRQIKKLCWMIKGGDAPMPNLITNSGHGLHLYYILDKPVPLYRENIPLLNKLKHGLTNILWNYHTSTDENTQYQGVLQGFRVPGTLTKFGEKIRSFHCREAGYHNIPDLNKFLFTYKLTDKEVNKLWEGPVYNPTGVTREEAARRWPEWYVGKVLKKQQVGKFWHVNRAVYDWWKKRLWDAKDEIKVHHRYWCILTLVVYGVKCKIPEEEVKRDAYELVPKLELLTDTEDNHFTTQDVDDAMRAYQENYNTWPIETIENTTLFRIDKNKRNKKRGRVNHLKVMNFVRDNISYPNGDWRKGNGRKKATTENSKEARMVQTWRAANPESNNKSACAKDTGLHRNTVMKWWKELDKKV